MADDSDMFRNTDPGNTCNKKNPYSSQGKELDQQWTAGPTIEKVWARIPFATVSKLGNFFSPRHPSSLSFMNEFLAIECGGNVSE